MKVGDIVRQGDALIKWKGRSPSTMLGVVVEMSANDTGDIPPKWRKWLGEYVVAVLWANGKLTENMAQRSLEVINDSS